MLLRYVLILISVMYSINIYGKVLQEKDVFTVKPANIVIQIPSKYNASIKIGAEELQKHLFLITGVKPPVTNDIDIKNNIYVFHVGTKYPGDKRPLVREEARYRITAKGAWFYGQDQFAKRYKNALEKVTDWVYSRVGTMFSIYNFLDRELKVRWPSPGDSNIVYTKQNPLQLRITSFDWTPELKVRLLWSTTYENWYYKRIVGNKTVPQEFKLNPKQQKQRQLEEKLWQRRMRMGQSVVYSHKHAFTRWWKKYGKNHPEFFAMDPQGQRKPWRSGGKPSRVCMCVSDPGLHKEIVKQWLIKKKRAPYWNETIGICENDSAGYCRCPECKKLDVRKKGEAFGKHMTDRYISFANNILKIAKKQYPDAQACMFAYMEYRFPPRKTRINKDIIFSFVPKLWDTEKELEDLYKGWRKMGAEKILLRTNELHVDIGLPMGFEEKIFRNFKIGVKNHIVGTRYDAIQSFWPSSGIVNYILARGFYAPKKSFEHWEQEYCDTYGKASPYIKNYYIYWRKNIWEKRLYPNRLKIVKNGDGFMRQGLYWSRAKYYREKDFDITDSILQKASVLKLKAETKERLNRLILANKHARKLYRAMKAGAQYNSKASNQTVSSERLSSLKKLRNFRLKNKDKLQFCWGRLINHENYFADGAGNILGTLIADSTPFTQLPKYWYVKQEQTGKGKKSNWLNNKLAFKSWGKIPINCFWQRTKNNSQLGKELKNYKGNVWYAIELPDKNQFKDKKVYLVFGGIRGNSWIYVNGELVLQQKNNWRHPFAVRIDEYLKDTNNVLFVKVRDIGTASGIWRPVWLFTGGIIQCAPSNNK